MGKVLDHSGLMILHALGMKDLFSIAIGKNIFKVTVTVVKMPLSFVIVSKQRDYFVHCETRLVQLYISLFKNLGGLNN